MTTHRVPLSRTEEAFVAMVMQEHKASYLNADQLKDARLNALRLDKGVPDRVDYRVTGRTETSPPYLEYGEAITQMIRSEMACDDYGVAGPPAPDCAKRSREINAPESATGV